jgi:hypothetical protein
MYSEYEKYLLNIRNSLIQNGIEFPEITKGSMSYYELFKLGIKLSDILLYYRVLAVSGSGDGLENFFLPINTSYVDKIRGICYSEFVSDVLPNYKKLSLGIEPEEETDDVALEDVENTEEVESDFSEDLFNSMFEEDNTEEDVSDDTDDSIENDFDATIKQRLNENTEYVPNGVYLEEVPSEGYSNDVVYTDSGTFLDDESDMEESSYDEESEDEGYSDESDTYEESDYSVDDEDDYEESDYSEDEEDYSESNYSDDEDYSESDYSEDDEGDYEEGDYSVDDEDDYVESDYSEDEEDAYEESDYSEDEDDYAENDYSEDYEESDYSDDEDDYEESDYSQDEEDDYEESDYSEDDGDGTYSSSNADGVKPKKTKDLGDEIQDITNTVLTGLKQKAINFLKKKE